MTRRNQPGATVATAIVVHGHRDGNHPGGKREISEECRARVRAAEAAARQRRINEILLCGAGASGSPSEARQMAACWQGPPARLWLDELSTDTAENAEQALQWARTVEAEELVVISSWWHLRLALYYRPFKRAGITIHHQRSRRSRRILRHLIAELRYMPHAIRTSRRPHVRPDTHTTGSWPRVEAT